MMRTPILLLLAAALAGQEPTPTLRVSTRLVLINVVVHDKKSPVADLTERDFEIFDGGNPRKISFFSMVSAKPLSSSVSAAKAANVFSNRAAERTDAPTTATVLLLDGLNTDLRSKAFVKEQILRFLSKIDPSDKIAIYALGRELHIVHDFTDDRAHLAKVLARYRTGEVHEMQGSEVDLSDVLNPKIKDMMQNALQNEADFTAAVRGRTTLSALQAIANHLAGVPGRKNLIWITGSFPFCPGCKAVTGPFETARPYFFSADAERTARWFNDANMAIYPVDARGVSDVYKTFTADRSRSNMDVRMQDPKTPFHADNRDTIKIMADRTGGVAYYDTNDLAGAIRRATEDAQVSYTLGFYAPEESLDGRFHELKVHVHRKGVQARYRKGYMAVPEPPSTAETRATALREAVWSPLESSVIELLVRADRVPGGKPEALDLGIGVNPATFTLQPAKDGGVAGALDLVVLESDAQGKVLRSTKHTVQVDLTRERYAALKGDWLTFHRTLEIAPGSSVLRVVVQDANTGALGSVHVPLSQLRGGPLSGDPGPGVVR